MENKIAWKTITIETVYEGVLLIGTLRYWAKDCEVHLLEPAKAKRVSHLMYSQPVRYTTDEIVKEGITDIDVNKQAQETLISLYKGIT